MIKTHEIWTGCIRKVKSENTNNIFCKDNRIIISLLSLLMFRGSHISSHPYCVLYLYNKSVVRKLNLCFRKAEINRLDFDRKGFEFRIFLIYLHLHSIDLYSKVYTWLVRFGLLLTRAFVFWVTHLRIFSDLYMIYRKMVPT